MTENRKKMFLLLCGLLTVSCTAYAGWQINPQNASSPLTLDLTGVELEVLDGIAPVFPGNNLPEQVSLLSYSVVGDYAVFECRATYQSQTIDYYLKFRQIDTISMEMIVEGISGVAERFVCGNITGTSEQFKQFYIGQRETELHEGTSNTPAILFLPSEEVYIYGLWDADFSMSSGVNHRLRAKENFLATNPPVSSDAVYHMLSDSSRLLLKERYVFTFSADLWQACSPLDNNPSEFRYELADTLMLDQWGGSGFRYGKFMLNWLEEAAGGHLDFLTIIHGWDSHEFDATNPDRYQRGVYDEPAGNFGTKEGLLDYIDLGKYTGRMALHCNYLSASDDSWSIDEGFADRAVNIDGEPAWYTDMGSIMPLVQRQETEIKEDLSPNALFYDQIASGTVVNFDADAAGAGSISMARQFAKDVCQYGKQLHNAPLVSESLASEYLLGEYVDTGDFSIMNAYNRYDFTPEYKLRRIHHLSAFHSIGLGYRHFYPSGYSDRVNAGNADYFLDDEKLDSYRSVQILYGNAAYLYSHATDIYGLRKAHALTECFTVGVLQKYYLLKTVDYVLYGKEGQWKTLEEVISSSSYLAEVQSWYKQFHIRYTNGTNVFVNRSDQNLIITLPDSEQITLPQNGWTVYTEDGQVVGYTALVGGERVDYCEDNNRQIVYANPRAAASFKGVSIPTVWLDEQKHIELENPNQMIFDAFRKSFRNVAGADKGDVISWFSTGESPIYGIDVTGLSESKLHIINANGQVYNYLATSAFDTTRGKMSVYDEKNIMTDADPNSHPQAATTNMRALTAIRTYEAPYGMRYISSNNQRTTFRTTWGYPEGNDIGDMVWITHTNIWQLLSGGDITPSARAKIGDQWPSVWTVFSGELESVYQDKIYLYPSTAMAGRYDFTESFDMEKPLRGVSLGDEGELWVLCQDTEVLRISSIDGSIIDRFFLSEDISSPWGIAFDPKGRLWITSTGGTVYQVAIESNPIVYLQADLNRDFYVDLADFAIVSQQWLNEADPNGI